MLNLGFALLLQFSFNSLALPLLTGFCFFDTPLSFSFALLQRLCFFGCSLKSKCQNSECYQLIFSPAIVQCPIVLVRAGLDGSSTYPPADVLYW